jgi:hypothetical protein
LEQALCRHPDHKANRSQSCRRLGSTSNERVLVKIFNLPRKLRGLFFWFFGFAGRKLSSKVFQPLLDIQTPELRIALGAILVQSYCFLS